MVDPDPSTMPLVVAADDLERWLALNGETSSEYWIKYYKKSSPSCSIDLPSLIDVALCYGWVDVKGRRVDEELTATRFTPRRPKSNWSPTNRAAARRLIEEGRMQPQGYAKLPADL